MFNRFVTMSENIREGSQRNLTDFSMFLPVVTCYFVTFSEIAYLDSELLVYARRQIHAKFGPNRLQNSLDIVAGEKEKSTA